MLLPRIRLRLWWLMALVAAIALILGTWIELPRFRNLSRSYRERAEHYAELERRALWDLEQQRECLAYWSALALEREKKGETHDSPGHRDGDPDAVESGAERVARTKEQAAWHAKEAAIWERRATHYARLRQKYQRSATYPWLPVEPDPPEPHF
jgi:hypothetical protein